MNRSTHQLIIAAALFAAPAAALAEPVQEARCTTDSLSSSEAIARLDWARRCGLTTNSGGPTSFFPSTRAWDAAGFPVTIAGAKEYRETNPNRAYTGNSNAYEVNYYNAYYRYEASPLYTVAQETSGPTAGYWKWVGTTPRLRPNYPSFDTTVTGTGTQLFPSGSPSDCSLYTKNPTTGALTLHTGNHYVAFYCESSCYTPDQNLRFSTGEVNILEAMKTKRDDVITLSPDATLDDLATQTQQVFSYTAEIRDAEHVIFKVKTASGGALSVTNEHPMVTSEGRLVTAEKLKVGEELLKADGTPDPIVSLEKTTHFGKVYNLKPQSRDHVANILIAQGYLVGSARFQNDYVAYMNRILLFRAVPEIAMPK